MADPFAALSREPDSLTSGVYCAWRIRETYDPVLYSVAYSIGGRPLPGVHDGGGWLFTAGKAFTSLLTVGNNVAELTVRRLLDDEVSLIRAFNIRVFAGAQDRRSHAALMVQKIESVLNNRADSDVESYTIKSRSINKMPVSELIEWREYYLAELGREADPITGRRKNKNTATVRFI